MMVNNNTTMENNHAIRTDSTLLYSVPPPCNETRVSDNCSRGKSVTLLSVEGSDTDNKVESSIGAETQPPPALLEQIPWTKKLTMR